MAYQSSSKVNARESSVRCSRQASSHGGSGSSPHSRSDLAFSKENVSWLNSSWISLIPARASARRVRSWSRSVAQEFRTPPTITPSNPMTPVTSAVLISSRRPPGPVARPKVAHKSRLCSVSPHAPPALPTALRRPSRTTSGRRSRLDGQAGRSGESALEAADVGRVGVRRQGWLEVAICLARLPAAPTMRPLAIARTTAEGGGPGCCLCTASREGRPSRPAPGRDLALASMGLRHSARRTLRSSPVSVPTGQESAVRRPERRSAC